MGLGVAEAEDDSFGFLQRFRVFLFCLVLGVWCLFVCQALAQFLGFMPHCSLVDPYFHQPSPPNVPPFPTNSIVLTLLLPPYPTQ